MKRYIVFLLCILLLAGTLGGCTDIPQAEIAATTLPVYEFTAALCAGTPLTVARLVTQDVSCLHDYALNVRQVKALEAAQVIVLSGAGLEESFLSGTIPEEKCIDASSGLSLLCPETGHDHDPGHDHSHSHEQDPHIWLSPENAMVMAENICQGLTARYPQYEAVFSGNLAALLSELEALLEYGRLELAGLTCRDLVTFHDGFSYFAQCFDLTILEAVEEESGSEASAKELIHLISIVEHHALPAIFIERNGSVSAADVIARETGALVFSLDMVMAGDSYFEAMYHNINTVKEALG